MINTEFKCSPDALGKKCGNPPATNVVPITKEALQQIVQYCRRTLQRESSVTLDLTMKFAVITTCVNEELATISAERWGHLETTIPAVHSQEHKVPNMELQLIQVS